MGIKDIKTTIVEFIRDYIAKYSSDGAILGLSGGLDSSVVAALAVEALGSEKVDAIALPYRTSNPSSLHDAYRIADFIGLDLKIIDITSAVDAVVENRQNIDQLRLGNICARMRMIYLYDISAESGKLVLGTGNRTEKLLGYFTLWGDSACAIAPLGDLYKTQERKLAEHIGLPDWIISKTPTADLWRGQTDEDEMGITYETADKILRAMFDENRTHDELIETGFEEKNIDLVITKYRSNQFKRTMPPYPKLELHYE